MVQGLSFDIEDLRLLAAIYAARSLSGGAKRLGVDHSSAFRRLGKLEQRLGVRLFDRARDGYTPTPAGELTVATATRMIDDLLALEHKLAGEDLRPSGIVRVTTTDTLVDFLAPAFRSFQRAHPEITLEVVVALAFLTLTRRDADVAIRAAEEPGEALVGRRVGEIAFSVYGSRAALGEVRTENIGDHSWVGFDESLGHLAAAKWMKTHVGNEQITHRANTLPAIQTAVRSGMGLAALPCFMGDADPELVRITGTISELETPLWVLTHPDLKRVARIRTFLDHIAAEIGYRRGMLQGLGPSEVMNIRQSIPPLEGTRA